MTHLYTLLVGGTVIPGGGVPDATAIAWAGDTILAIGDDDAIRAISRGDSHVVDLAGATVVALDPSGHPGWPTAGLLEVGGPANLVVVPEDPRAHRGSAPNGSPVRSSEAIAVVEAGRVVLGWLAGSGAEVDEHHRR